MATTSNTFSINHQFYQANQLQVPKAAKVETVKELKTKLKAAEKREKEAKKQQKLIKAQRRVAAKRRGLAIKTLEDVAKNGVGDARVRAAEKLLSL